jgi:SAM-dependent methyltransferase
VIKVRQRAEVTGIEIDSRAAEEAQSRLDRVIVADVEEVEPDFPVAQFDAIICGDILEHLREPGAVLRRARGWLASGGRVVASLPNVRHHSIVRSLLDGNWTYEPAGLLDRDHVWFFTRSEIEELFHEAGLRIVDTQVVPGPGYAEWEQVGRPGVVKIGRLCITGLSHRDTEEFYVYQFLVVAVPREDESARAWQEEDHPASTRPASDAAALPGEMSSEGSPPSSWSGSVEAQRPVAHHRRVCPTLSRCAAGGSAREEFGSKPDLQEGSPGVCLDVSPFRSRRMRFTQNFITDFDQFNFWGEPFAFVRFGDGERAICIGRPVEAQDGWSYDGLASQFAGDLNASLRYNDPNYYMGISDGCCDRPSRDWYLSQLTVPIHQVTFANIFVNGNYRRFRQLELAGTVIVSSGRGDIQVPEDLVNGDYDLDGIINQLLSVDRPILVAAGPASCIIVHKYWMRAERRQTIVDVGSAIDELTKGRKTRQYQFPGSRTAELICTW